MRERTYLVQSVDDAIHKMAGVLGEQVVDHLMNKEQSWYTRQQKKRSWSGGCGTPCWEIEQ